MDHLSLTKKIVSLGVLLLIVAASATQTEVAKYVSAERGYSKAYFTFYLTHSMFVVIAPLHLVLLRTTRPKISFRQYREGLRVIVAKQLSLPDDTPWRFVGRNLLKVILLLTCLLSIPSICWYVAVPLTGVSEITTLYASSTFWTYGFALWLLREPLSRVIISAISVAFVGVLLITYSGVEGVKPDALKELMVSSGPNERKKNENESPHRILGDMIMLAGSVALGYYEVIYKKILPESQGGVGKSHDDDRAVESTVSNGPGRGQYRRISSNAGDAGELQTSPRISINPIFHPETSIKKTVEGGHLPIALHANFLTSLIGFATLAILWVPVPLLHWLDIETFELPTGIWGWMLIIFLAGATYNAGFMVLIGILGPVTASLANLLTIAVVAIIETLFGKPLNFWTMLGASFVGLGFGLIVWEGERMTKEDDAESVGF